MKHIPYLLFLVPGLALIGCQYDEKGRAEDRFQKGYEKGWKDAATTYVDEKIADLKEEISLKEFELEMKLLNLESEFNSEKFDNFLKFLDLEQFKDATFNLHDPGGFQSVKANNLLTFFISVKDVVPYMDGYKIKFNIGNPNHVTINNMTLTLDWWLNSYLEEDYFKLEEGDNDVVEKLKKSKSKIHKILTPIEKGKWNSVEVIIPSINDKDAKRLRVKLGYSIVSLSA